jgi:DNA-directed RNA polymerase specialized sigma24 family protein
MRFIQGESDAAIAAALGCAAQTVREHLERGRERLGRMLGRLDRHRIVPATPATTNLHTEKNS